MVDPSQNRLVSTAYQKNLINFACSIKIIFFKMVKFTWKIRNVLNRKRNQFSDFFLRVMVIFDHSCTQITPIFDEFSRYSKNKNHKQFLFRFSIYSAHSAYFIKIWQLLELSKNWLRLWVSDGYAYNTTRLNRYM